MEQRSLLDANSKLANQEIPRLLLNPKIHYWVHKITTLVPILSQIHPVHAFLLNFPKVHKYSHDP